MPKINRVRIVNFTYNENRHIYDSIFDYFGGANTLNILANGGGKSVLVHMLMQPIVPKRNLKDRLFKSYFSKPGAPTYIMIEWLLDNNAGRVMTGIGIKVSAGKSNEEDSDDSIRVITFTSEYKRPNPFDIERMELTDKEESITRMLEFDRVIKSLSAAEKGREYNVRIYRWEIPEDKRKYSEELVTYKINPDEWKSLMAKINEKEAGLSNFFDDCKNCKTLINKWFIPAIEEQLNKNGNVIEQIRQLIKNHAAQLVLNEKIIAEKKVFELFKVQSQKVTLCLEKYQKSLDAVSDMERKIGNLYRFLEQKIQELHEKQTELKSQITDIDGALNEVLYDRLSYDYDQIRRTLAELQQEVGRLEQNLNAIREVINQLKHQEQVLECAELYEELQEIERDIISKTTELEKETLAEKEIEARLNDIHYTLNIRYTEKIGQENAALQAEQNKLAELGVEIGNQRNSKINCQKRLEQLSQQLMDAGKMIAIFDQSEIDMKAKYREFTLERNFLLQEYDTKEVTAYQNRLQEKKEFINGSLASLQKEKEENLRKGAELGAAMKEFNERIGKQISDINNLTRESKDFETARQEVLRIFRNRQIKEELLFFQSEVVDMLDTEMNKYHDLIRELSRERELIEKNIQMYESGKLIALTTELRQMFDELNIDIEFGFEWLKNYAIPVTEKAELLKKNPFIPYSLIIASRDFKILKSSNLDLFTSMIFPVIEREGLEAGLKVVVLNQIHEIGGMNFLMSFNAQLLDEQHLKALVQGLKAKLLEINQRIETAQQAVSNIITDKNRILAFQYTEAEIEQLKIDIEKAQAKLDDFYGRLAELEGMIATLSGRNEEINREKETNKAQETYIIGQIDSFGIHLKLYQSYLVNKETRDSCEKSIKSMKEKTAELEELIEKLNGEEYHLNSKIVNLKNEVERIIKEQAKYSQVMIGVIKTGTINELEAERAGLISQQGVNIQFLKEVIDNLAVKKKRKTEKLGKYNVSTEEYASQVFNAIEFQQIRYSRTQSEQKERQLTGTFGQLTGRIEGVEGKLMEKSQEISAQCQSRPPKEIDLITDFQFDRIEDALKQKRHGLDAQLLILRNHSSELNNEINKLDEYRAFGESIAAVEPVDSKVDDYRGNLIQTYKSQLIDRDNSKEILGAEYRNLENEFIDEADIFKQLFTNLLADEKKFKYEYGNTIIERTKYQIEMKLDQHRIDIQKVQDMERSIIDVALEYVKNVYDEMSGIDKNSSIDVLGAKKKMLIISLPERDGLVETILKEYLNGTIEHCVSLYKQNQSMDNLLSNDINTLDLFDRLVGINKLGIDLTKVEQNKTMKLSWQEAISTSGGEKFVSAFVIFISLLTYSRGSSALKTNQDSKVLIMDNPFGAISSEHLLVPLFDIAKKYDTQLICFTDHDKPAICDRFNLIYALSIEKEVGRNDEYLEVKLRKNLVESQQQQEEDEYVAASLFKMEQQKLF